MPIKDLSDDVRLPRLGKIHLGTRHPEKGYPQKADHFVFPQDHPDYKKLVEIFGEKPKELNILIPVEDEEIWATQYYKAYNQTYGLVCKGDGEVALRMVDIQSEELPQAKVSGAVTMKEIECKGRNCPEYQAKKCHEVMNLRFILPEIPGLGVWQIDTGSKNSILNINSCAKVIQRAFGKISMIPLKLTFEPIQVNNPETGKRQTVYVLNLRSNITLAELAQAAREQAKLLSAGTLDGAFESEVKQSIDELWGEMGTAREIVPEPVSETPQPVTEATGEVVGVAVPEVPPEPELEPEPEPTRDERPVTQADLTQLKEAMSENGYGMTELGALITNELKFKGIAKLTDLKKWQLDEIVKHIKKG